MDVLYHWVQLWSDGTDPAQWLKEGKKRKLQALMHGPLERLRLYVLPHYGFFPAKDGMLALGIVMEKKFWHHLSDQVGRPFMKEFSLPMRVMSRQLIRQILNRRFSQKTMQEWVDSLSELLPLAPVLSPEEAQDHDAMAERPGVLSGSAGIPLPVDPPSAL